MNLMVYQYEESLLVVDCGLTFPTPETPGVDVIIPDIQYLRDNKEKVLGYFLTHGHEDHIGALPYILPEIPAPIYGTPMTLGMLEGKLREHQLLGEVELNRIQYRNPIQIGPFTVRYLHVTHSIIDGSALAITTPRGTVIHTGDFKIDHTPVDGCHTDLYSLAQFGESGVLALLSDSTNVNNPGSTLSEKEIRATFDDIFPKASGLIIVATFSSNIQRIRQVIEAAAACGRKVLLNGRSMLANVQVARSLNYLNVPADTLVEQKSFTRVPRNQLLVLSTGSQGEPNSSLVRIARGEHKDINILPGDTVILSSKFIPGNELTIGSLINMMYRKGARVIHDKVSEVHVSGHASREDLKLMLSLTRPRFFLPIHGELRHLHSHRELAMEMGISPTHTLVAENGQRVRLDEDSITLDGQVANGRVFVDGKSVGDVGDIVLRDRRHLSEDGLVVAVIILEKATGLLVQGPELLTRGVTYEEQSQELLELAKEAVKEALQLGPKAMDFGEDEEAGPQELTVRALRRFFKRRLGRRPVVIPLVVEM
ncbi:MAG: ribonuclease J [Magnetococcales bacterium]|nr:ribonuclease J [Magnetococcales bacterium]NGZ27717.1 ribonuclease J [Magnetococcales bacterium]